MNTTYNNFIGIYDNVYLDGYCDHLINQFERIRAMGSGIDRWQAEKARESHKNDFQIMLNVRAHNSCTENFEGNNVCDIFYTGLQTCYEEYVKKFSILLDDNIKATAMKMQKTYPGGGYHVWHPERCGAEPYTSRVLVYSLYLNNLGPDDGGETEFLYQRLRVKPKKNQMVIWPACFSHTHRGNTVLGNTPKYIITGWFDYN